MFVSGGPDRDVGMQPGSWDVVGAEALCPDWLASMPLVGGRRAFCSPRQRRD